MVFAGSRNRDDTAQAAGPSRCLAPTVPNSEDICSLRVVELEKHLGFGQMLFGYLMFMQAKDGTTKLGKACERSSTHLR